MMVMGEGVLVEIAVTRAEDWREVASSGPALVRGGREEEARRMICVVERCILFFVFLVIRLVIEEVLVGGLVSWWEGF